MNINSIQGMNAYTANALMADTTSVQNNTKEATSVDLNKASSQPVQEAFKVDITPEALALQSENTEALAEEAQDQLQTMQTQQPQGRQGILLDVIA
ncbi:hypothetical protein [Desulfobacter sp.]|uniref:hypothetical protein n=1 Tax=Desulfobacter sp. TaxID=2294 RepID=UPI003D0DD6DF